MKKPSFAGRRCAAMLLPLVLLGASGAAPEPDPAETADLIFTDARVYTVEADRPWAQAVAIGHGRILAVGATAEVMRRKGEHTRIVDLGGRLLMPSFEDAHAHPVFGGMSHSRCSLHKGRTIDDYRRIIAACIARTPGSGTIFGIGWEDSLFPPNGRPGKEILDRISRDRPLIFRSVGGHSLWLNSKALALAGITKDTPDPANGHIDRDPATGIPSGSLQEAAMDLADALIPPPTRAEIEQSILYVAEHFNSMGITTWHDADVEISDTGESAVLEAYRAIRARGELTSHVTIALRWKNDRGVEQIPSIMRASQRARSYGLTARTVKFFLDGVIPQHTAAMLDPYAGSEDRGKTQVPPDILASAVTALGARGMQAHFHAIGDGAVHEALDAIEAARRRNGDRDLRPKISHLNVVEPEDQRRFEQLGAVAVFQPLWACEYPYMRLTEKAVGERRARLIYPADSILQLGGTLAYGSDWPVASANPLEGIEVAVTRTDPANPASGALLPNEGVPLAQAVRAYTLNVAFAEHLDKQTGSIAPGKSADLIVLDRNIFDIPVTDIHKAKVLLTLFEGRAVFGTVAAVDTSRR